MLPSSALRIDALGRGSQRPSTSRTGMICGLGACVAAALPRPARNQEPALLLRIGDPDKTERLLHWVVSHAPVDGR